MATIPQPNASITQQFVSTAANVESNLPVMIVGEKYSVLDYPEDKDKITLGSYSADDVENLTKSYPNKNSLSIIDKDYVKLFMEQLELRFYTSGNHKWRKIGSRSNRIRTILSDGLIFKTDPEGLFPHTTSSFKDRGVKVGDKVLINYGENELKTSVTGFFADKSAASIGVATANSGNKSAVTGDVQAASAGSSNSGTVTAASNEGDNFTGSLLKNVLSETYTAKVTKAGGAPTTDITNPDGATITVTTNAIYNFSAPETYEVEIVIGGAAETATYKVTSSSGIDNEAEQLTPALDTPVALGTRGLTITFAGSSTFTAGHKYIIVVQPSNARLEVTSNSKTDNVSSVVFPGFSTAVAIGTRGVTLTFSTGSGTTLTVGDIWTIDATKTVAAVGMTSGGTYSGSLDASFDVLVTQGGAFGECIIQVIETSSTGSKSHLLTVTAHSTALTVGSNGVTVTFANNSQGGLIKDDRFSFNAIASKDTAFKTLELADSLPSTAETTTVAAAAYAGSNGTPNTGESGGTYTPDNAALDLNNTEVYTVVVNTAGAFGVATFNVTSSSGLDDDDTDTLITAKDTFFNVGTKGVKIQFTDTQDFALTDRWTISVTKENLEVKLSIFKESVEISRNREENETQTAWIPNATDVTINNNIKLLDSEWSTTDALPIQVGTMFLKYRALEVVNANEVQSINNSTDADELLGSNHVDNPIRKGVAFALLNAGGTTLKAAFVDGTDLSAWSRLLDNLELRDNTDVYRIVPMTDDADIINLVKAHVEAMSTSTKNKWRSAMVSRSIPDKLEIVKNATATVQINPADSNKFNLLVTDNASFETVNVGDEILYLGSSRTVEIVNSATELKFTPALAGPQTVASALNIQRSPSAQEEADLYSFYAESLNSRRVVHVTPDKFESEGVTYKGYFAAAAIAGLKTAQVPHQPITNFNITGVTKVPKSLNRFTKTQLDQIASSGNLLLQQDSISTAPYIRHHLTTDVSSLEKRELNINDSFDDISYGILSILKPFIGKYNAHTGTLEQIKTDIEGFLFSKTGRTDERAGSLLISYKINNISLSNPDTINVDILLQIATAVNYIPITLTATASAI